MKQTPLDFHGCSTSGRLPGWREGGESGERLVNDWREKSSASSAYSTPPITVSSKRNTQKRQSGIMSIGFGWVNCYAGKPTGSHHGSIKKEGFGGRLNGPAKRYGMGL